jgi:acetyltransferase-like isoleucine patch superfamily enzyme
MNRIMLLLYILRIISTKTYAKYIGVRFGKNCDFQFLHFSTEPYLIEIGNHVQITSGTRFFTHSGGWVLRNKFPKWDSFGKIIIKDNVYIGNCVLIMPGVTIGNNVIVGAGSVVTKSIPDNSVVAGNPAKFITDLESYVVKNNCFNTDLRGVHNKSNAIKRLPDEMLIKKGYIV